ncbi:MAG: hypothetical protein ABIN48_03570 [Ginsengibacter sp.]
MRLLRYIIIPLFFAPYFASASASDTTNIPFSRIIFHEKIIDEQKRADKIDGKIDGLIKAGSNEEVNLQITDALYRKVNALRNEIEINKTISTNNDKVRYLRYLEQMMVTFVKQWKSHEILPSIAPALLDNFRDLMIANINGENMAQLVKKASYEVAAINTPIFTDNPGYKESRNDVFLKFCTLYPEKIMANIGPFADEPFADSLVIVAFTKNPSQLYSYAQSTGSRQGRLIRRINDDRIKAVVQLSSQNRALFYFPFLDDLISGKQSIESISKVVGTSNDNYDSLGYFKLLVKTEIDYQGRLIKGDTPIAMLDVNGLQDILNQRAIQHFVTPVNELHDYGPSIRFKAIMPLTAQELYYMMIAGENELFTSSYKFIFDRFMQKMGPNPRGDSLLLSVNFDKFKKFIKMSAGYGKLDEFLRTMPENAQTLMQAFVAKLETTGTLEDAVDVADSYGSVNPTVQKSMLQNIEWNIERCKRENNDRGVKIYSLLRTIFLSADPANNVDLSKEIGIPPVYTVDHNYITDEQGRVVELVFFYGDEDGRISFASYMTSFPKSQWDVVYKKEWVEIKSNKGKPVWIFANLPLDNNLGKDSEAQEKLRGYLEANNLRPSVVIHRGHSYHLPFTIKQLPEDSKIIMLGSCGGYNNLKDILTYAPDAHIISTKQLGTTNVNKYIIDALDNSFVSGKTIDWKQMWDGLENSFSRASRQERETFEDYIPPQKNLGALFIKAYTKLGGMDDAL